MLMQISIQHNIPFCFCDSNVIVTCIAECEIAQYRRINRKSVTDGTEEQRRGEEKDGRKRNDRETVRMTRNRENMAIYETILSYLLFFEFNINILNKRGGDTGHVLTLQEAP